jgi:hypothetical protein
MVREEGKKDGERRRGKREIHKTEEGREKRNTRGKKPEMGSKRETPE